MFSNQAQVKDMAMSKIELLQVGSYPDWVQAVLEQTYVMHRYFEVPQTAAGQAAADQAAFLARVGGAIRGIATRGDLGADAAMIAALPKLEVIAVYGVGYDGVDLAAAQARGIRVTNTPDVLTGDVADLAVGMWLAGRRRMVEADAWARSGNWAAKGAFPITRRAFGKSAGILGLGRIGRAIGDRLQGFGMQISYTSRAAKATPGWQHIEGAVALAEVSDVMFVALAATPDTRHIVDARVLAALGPDGMLVNISRAANVDEAALIAALRDGSLGAAALDVFDGEPAYDPAFQNVPNLLMQPHIGSGTLETRLAMAELMCDNLAAHFAGQPLLTPVI